MLRCTTTYKSIFYSKRTQGIIRGVVIDNPSLHTELRILLPDLKCFTSMYLISFVSPVTSIIDTGFLNLSRGFIFYFSSSALLFFHPSLMLLKPSSASKKSERRGLFFTRCVNAELVYHRSGRSTFVSNNSILAAFFGSLISASVSVKSLNCI